MQFPILASFIPYYLSFEKTFYTSSEPWQIEIEHLLSQENNAQWSEVKYVDDEYYICMKFYRFAGGRIICRYPEEKDGKVVLYPLDGDPNKPVWELR